MSDKNIIKRRARMRRKKSIKKKIFGTESKPRMVVFRSLKHMHVQLIDDITETTLTSLSTNSSRIAERLEESKSRVDAGFRLGEIVGELAKEKGITRVVFDRSGYLYHGRVKAVAEGARKAGLEF